MSRDGASAGIPLPDAVYVAFTVPGRRFLLSGRVTQARALELVNTRPGARLIEADDRVEAFQRAADEIGVRAYRDREDTP